MSMHCPTSQVHCLSLCAGATGAELKACCTEAGMFALRERRMHVTQEDFEMAVGKVMKKVGGLACGVFLAFPSSCMAVCNVLFESSNIQPTRAVVLPKSQIWDSLNDPGGICGHRGRCL